MKQRMVKISAATVAFFLCTAIWALSEDQKINLLYQEIRNTRAVFIRNGVEYDAETAVSHLKRKRDYAGDRIKTARHFIEYLATKSSVTGIPYKIRFPDGREVESATFLLQTLERIESQK